MVRSMMAGGSVRTAGRTSEASGWALKAARTAAGETASATSFPGAAGGLTETLMPRPGWVMRGKITDPGLPSSAGMPLPPGAAAWILGPVAAATGRLGDRADDVPPGEHELTATTAAAIN